MTYGKFRRFLTEEFREIQESILIESPFIETTRNGKYLYTVLIALTPNHLMIALEPRPKTVEVLKQNDAELSLQHLYPLELVHMNVFKRRSKQSLKFCIGSGRTRYFELGAMKKRNIFWELWCYHAARLRDGLKIQPDTKCKNGRTDCKILKEETNRLKWHDKYLYLGLQREKEDIIRPKPVPGLGPTEDIKLLYLKPKYFGCWDQSEHWVQCSSGSTIFSFI